MGEALTIELEQKTRQALDRLAQQTNRAVSDLVNQAVRDYLELQEWQRRKIEAGIAAAERGEFAPDEELARVAEQYSGPSERPNRLIGGETGAHIALDDCRNRRVRMGSWQSREMP